MARNKKSPVCLRCGLAFQPNAAIDRNRHLTSEVCFGLVCEANEELSSLIAELKTKLQQAEARLAEVVAALEHCKGEMKEAYLDLRDVSLRDNNLINTPKARLDRGIQVAEAARAAAKEEIETMKTHGPDATFLAEHDRLKERLAEVELRQYHADTLIHKVKEPYSESAASWLDWYNGIQHAIAEYDAALATAKEKR
jgi:DNA repair exonuclease SbcCD ATPase subunit